MKFYICANRACRARLKLETEPKVGQVAICDDTCGKEYLSQQNFFLKWLDKWQPEHRPN